MIVVVGAVSWVLVGALLGVYEARRGHWQWLWLLGAMAGPFALPLYRQIQQNERETRPLTVSAGSRRDVRGLRVLAGIDGSDASVAAARQVAELLGSRMGELCLAIVADYEINETGPDPLATDAPWVQATVRTLEGAAHGLSEWLGFEPATVVLAGRPALALDRHTTEAGFDVLAVGARGHGLSQHVFGSCASQLSRGAGVPVLVLPGSSERVGHAGPSEPTRSVP